MHTGISLAILAIGAVLMIGKIHADSEPGAIPILLVLLGIGWFIVARFGSRPHQKLPH